MNCKQMLFVVFTAFLCCAFNGCGRRDENPRAENLRLTNPMVIAVTGVRIDGVDIGLELKPGDTKRIPMTWELGTHTCSFRFTPPDVEGATPFWTKPRDFEIAADATEARLVIHIDVKHRIDEERCPHRTMRATCCPLVAVRDGRQATQ